MRVYFKKKTHDYPKKSGDCYLAWYNKGEICIMRKKPAYVCKAQHIRIQVINQISQKLWKIQNQRFKSDLAEYARAYKITYPGLRKRGISAYSIFIMIIHGLIKRFSLQKLSENLLSDTLSTLLNDLSVYRCVLLNLLKRVPYVHRLNHKTVEDSDQGFNRIEFTSIKRNKIYHFEIILFSEYINSG